MKDETYKKDFGGQTQIYPDEEQLAYWTGQFNSTADQLADAIRVTGTTNVEIRDYLKRMEQK